MEERSFRRWCYLILGAIAFYCALLHLSIVLQYLGQGLSLLAPFMLGGSIAFILNVPMAQIESLLFAKTQNKKGYVRPLALIVTLLLFVAVIWLATALIIPNLKEAVATLPDQISTAFDSISAYVQSLSITNHDIEFFLSGLNLDWDSISKTILSMAQSLANSVVSSGSSLVGGVVSGITTFVVGLVFSFYVLLQKEKLAHQGTMVLYALLPKDAAAQVVSVSALCNRVFSSFLSGQCLEAVILGVLFIIAMSIFQMPYAVLIGVLVSITALIPLVGAFIGCIVGIFLIALINPMQALAFLVLFLVLQQIEGNLIYPYVVGNSVGLPSIWVLAAVYIGGNLMGILGMLVFIPLSSVCYALFREFVYTRLKERNLSDII